MDANLNILVEHTVSTAMQVNQNKFLNYMMGVIQNQFAEMKETMTNSQKDMNERAIKAEALVAKKVKDERAKKRPSRRFGSWNREGQCIPTVKGAGDQGRGSRKRELLQVSGNPVTGSESARPRLLR